MLERASPLAGMTPFEATAIRIAAASDFTLTQAAGDVTALKTAFPKLPDRIGVSVEHAGRAILRIGPKQLWIIGTQPEASEGIFLTPLSSSRSCIAIEGANARDLLSKCAAIDFHPKVFTPATFVMTGIHHMPVLVHCVGPDAFQIYALRTFALSVWEVLADAGHS